MTPDAPNASSANPLTFVHEDARQTPVRDTVDVVVVGGGIAGVAAAIAAARNGASVCLLEKQAALGGLATIGNVIEYLPICDGNGRQVIAGLGEELLQLSIEDSPEAMPDCWRPDGDVSQRLQRRYRVTFNAASYMLALERQLLAEGVKLLYDCRFCSVARDGDRIAAVIVENKSGRQAIACRTAVDATGDADVCFTAGEETVSLDTNVRAGWFYSWDGKEFNIHVVSEHYDPHTLPTNGGRYRGDDVDSVTQQIIDTREMLLRPKLRKLSEKTGRRVQPAVLPLMADLRMTRRLKGEQEVCEADDGKVFDDTVGLTGDWRKPGPVWSIPYRGIRGRRNINLAVAGRCIAADNTVWDVTRAIPGCAVTGEAAGTAAALACQHADASLPALDIDTLQTQLRNQGAILGK